MFRKLSITRFICHQAFFCKVFCCRLRNFVFKKSLAVFKLMVKLSPHRNKKSNNNNTSMLSHLYYHILLNPNWKYFLFEPPEPMLEPLFHWVRSNNHVTGHQMLRGLCLLLFAFSELLQLGHVWLQVGIYRQNLEATYYLGEQVIQLSGPQQSYSQHFVCESVSW